MLSKQSKSRESRVSSESGVSSANSVNSVPNVTSVNCVNSESSVRSLGAGASSISNGIFTTDISKTWLHECLIMRGLSGVELNCLDISIVGREVGGKLCKIKCSD